MDQDSWNFWNLFSLIGLVMISGKQLEKRSVKELPTAVLQEENKGLYFLHLWGEQSPVANDSTNKPISWNVNINSQLFGSESIPGGNAMM